MRSQVQSAPCPHRWCLGYLPQSLTRGWQTAERWKQSTTAFLLFSDLLEFPKSIWDLGWVGKIFPEKTQYIWDVVIYHLVFGRGAHIFRDTTLNILAAVISAMVHILFFKKAELKTKCNSWWKKSFWMRKSWNVTADSLNWKWYHLRKVTHYCSWHIPQWFTVLSKPFRIPVSERPGSKCRLQLSEIRILNFVLLSNCILLRC